MRYFLIDKVTELVPGERARGVKCVTLTDEALHDHFPDFPILPGALLVEGAAQLAGLLIEATVNGPDAPPRRALLVQIDRAKFKETTGPGDRIELTATLEQQLEGAARVAVEASVEGRRVARATLTFMLKQIDLPRVHEQRQRLYRLWMRDLDPRPEVF